MQLRYYHIHAAFFAVIAFCGVKLFAYVDFDELSPPTADYQYEQPQVSPRQEVTAEVTPPPARQAQLIQAELTSNHERSTEKN